MVGGQSRGAGRGDRNVCQTKGFTLIEAVLVMATMVTLFVFSAVLADGWLQNARITQAQGVLQNAYGMTKTVALQNPSVAVSGDGAAIACFSTTNPVIVTVYQGNSCSGSSTQSWIDKLPLGVSVTFNTQSFNCLGLTNDGVLIAQSSSGTNCSNSLSYTLSLTIKSNTKSVTSILF